jgi:hypothetical protein
VIRAGVVEPLDGLCAGIEGFEGNLDLRLVFPNFKVIFDQVCGPNGQGPGVPSVCGATKDVRATVAGFDMRHGVCTPEFLKMTWRN